MDEIDNRIYFKDGKSFALEKKLVHKLDKMLERCTQENPKKDALLINEGAEGEGKSNSSVVEAYYLKQKSGKEIHLFFRLEQLINYAKQTEGKILIWDEPSLDSLSTDQLKTINRNLLRLFMTVRKKRHFFIVNFTKFWKFPEYIVVDRALGLVHMYSRHELIAGRFIYIKKKNLENLWNGYSKARQRLYGKLKSFGGSFPDLMERYFDEMGIMIDGKVATFEEYEKAKDRAIFSIGVEDAKKKSKDYQKLEELRYKITKLAGYKGLTKEEIAKVMGIQSTRLREWTKLDLNPDFSLAKRTLEDSDNPDSINNVVVGRKNPSDDLPEDQDSPNNSDLEPENDDFDDDFDDS